MIRVTFVNNIGAGVVEQLEVAPGTSARDVLRNKLNGDLARYEVRVNRADQVLDQPLVDNAVISVFPKKVEGAR